MLRVKIEKKINLKKHKTQITKQITIKMIKNQN